jgi:uncharacterized protein (TIGR03437 family)
VSISKWRWGRPALVLLGLASLSAGDVAAQLRRVRMSEEGLAKPGMTRRERLEEKLAWHQANVARLEKLGVRRAARAATVTETGDIAVIQGDRNIITPVTPFDTVGQSLEFTPSGAGYTVRNLASAFESSLGNKLDFTVAPAVNPNPDADPGDDGYLIQELGFNFSFFGQTFSNVAISTNGFLGFNPGGLTQATFDREASRPISSLARFQAAIPRIAPFWHDLDARARQTAGAAGIYFRRDADRAVVTYNNIRDFPNDSSSNGVHRFQVTLFRDGRILFSYDRIELTSTGLTGVSPGSASQVTLVDYSAPPAGVLTGPIAEFYSTTTLVDDLEAISTFYSSRPGRDVYDFVYFMQDFNSDLGDAFAFYLPIRQSDRGIGEDVFDSDPGGLVFGATRIQGYLNMANLTTNPADPFAYPPNPAQRFFGANSALSIFGQEQGHRWLTYAKAPDSNSGLYLGRDNAHWSFYMNVESTTSHPAARRSSSMEGNVYRDNGDGSFTTTNLIDGYTRLDHYLMGLRPPTEVPDTFVISGAAGGGVTRNSGPRPNVTVRGTRRTVTIGDSIQANGPRNPDVASAQKNFRTAWVLLLQEGRQPDPALLDKIHLYRLAWESYFAESTDRLATLQTGLTEWTVPRNIAVTSAANYAGTAAPSSIATIFGRGLTSGQTAQTPSANLPTTLAGAQVRVNGTPAGLFFASPNQINFQIPRATNAATNGVQSDTALIEVFLDGQRIRAGVIQMAPAVPAFFTADGSGTGPAAALDAILNTPAPFSPRQANGQPNIISLYGTGFGNDGTDITANIASAYEARLDGNPVTLQYVGPAPGFPGLNQVNVILPANVPSGDRRLVVSRGGIPTNEVVLRIR